MQCQVQKALKSNKLIVILTLTTCPNICSRKKFYTIRHNLLAQNVDEQITYLVYLLYTYLIYVRVQKGQQR